MSDALYTVLAADVVPLLTALFTAWTCGLLGMFLVLGRRGLLADSIAHSVLPGLALAFLATGSRHPGWMLLGGTLAGACGALTVHLLERYGRLERSAAIGATFPVFFAAGLLLLERTGGGGVDLSPDCVLAGELELLFWVPPRELAQLLEPATLDLLPRPLFLCALALLATAGFLAALWPRLTAATFDPQFARTAGLRPDWTQAFFTALVAAAAVAAFQAVGSILVLTLFLAPAATARLLTDRLGNLAVLTLLIATLAVCAGYILATRGPALLGHDLSLSASGTIAATAGALLLLAGFLGPRRQGSA